MLCCFFDLADSYLCLADESNKMMCLSCGCHSALLKVVCVLIVCFHVLELLFDETALPRGMEVHFVNRGMNRPHSSEKHTHATAAKMAHGFRSVEFYGVLRV